MSFHIFGNNSKAASNTRTVVLAAYSATAIAALLLLRRHRRATKDKKAGVAANLLMQDYTARPLPPISAATFQRLTRFIQTLENKLRQATAPPPFQVLRMGSAYWQSHAVATAARLNLADHLAIDEQLPYQQLAVRAGNLHAETLLRLLRFLAGLGVFEETSQGGVFCHTAASAVLRNDHPNCIKSMLLFHNHPINYAAFDKLDDVIQTGTNGLQLSGAGRDVFDVMEKKAEYQALFSAGMQAVDSFSVPVLVAEYDYSGIHRIIDVGGATGTKSRAILRAHPHIQSVIVMDLPHVIEKAQKEQRLQDDDPKVSFVPCDLLKSDDSSLPVAQSSHDLYLMVAVLHALNDTDAVTALQTVRRAVGTTTVARVLVVDMVLEPAAKPNELTGPSFDCMMMVTSQGKERTMAQFQDLFQAAGFRLVRRVPARSVAGFLELAPV